MFPYVRNVNKSVPKSRPNHFVRLIKAAGLIAMAGTVLALLADFHWIADIFCHFKVQYVLLLIPAIIFLGWYKRWKMVGLMLGVLVYNTWGLLPYWFSGATTPINNVDTMRLISFNVSRTNTDFQGTIDRFVAENPDFIFLMEVHTEWNLYFDNLRSVYPHQHVVSHDSYTGVAFLSKHAWSEIEVLNLGAIPNPSIDVTFPTNSDSSVPLRIIATHPVPPFGAELTQSREKQLTDIVRRLNNEQANLVVGDFNLTPWSPSFSRILVAGQLTDATLGYGISPTLAPLPTWFGGLKVDHILRNEKIGIRNFRLGSNAGSDHHMLIFDFAVHVEN